MIGQQMSIEFRVDLDTDPVDLYNADKLPDTQYVATGAGKAERRVHQAISVAPVLARFG